MTEINDKDKESMLPPILAVDFDGTLVTNKYPEIGKIRPEVWSAIVNAQKHDCKIILWTSRTGKALHQAIQFCRNNGLVFDAINDNISEVKALGWDARKVFATYYIDDRMGVVYGDQFLPVDVVAQDG